MQEQSQNRKRRIHKILLGSGVALIAVGLIVGAAVYASKNSNDIPEIYRTASFDSTNEWYSACLEEANSCDFYFDGSAESVPVYDAGASAADTGFTAVLASRTRGSVLSANSNGDGSSFIFSDGEVAMKDYYNGYSKHQFKPSNGQEGVEIMHENFQGQDALDLVDGKCVKVYFSNWAVLKDGQTSNQVGMECAVFRTSVVPEVNEEVECEIEAADCEFYFAGHKSDVPTYDMSVTENDVAFSDQILARDGQVIGAMNSNGRFASFVLGGDFGEQTMQEYINAFTEYQFKPTGDVPKIMHETFQPTGDASGKCVKVYFTEWQAPQESEVNVLSTRETSCAVFRTA